MPTCATASTAHNPVPSPLLLDIIAVVVVVVVAGVVVVGPLLHA
jgi:hypothetical protein